MRLSALVLAAIVLIAAATPAASYNLITIRTGAVGGCGGLDPVFHYWAPNPTCAQPIITTPFAIGDFQSACLGPQASRVNPIGGWIPALPHDPAAGWIDWNPNVGCNGDPRSVLYCARFEVNTNCAPVADSVRVYWAADDVLGDPTGGPNPGGVYINGVSLGAAFAGGNFTSEHTAVAYNVPLLSGINHIHIYQRDLACVVSGVILSCNIYVRSGSAVSGIKFNDANCNGVQDSGEAPLSGWTINLSGPVNQSTTTGAGGIYTFTNIPPGNYTVSEVNQPGWVECGPLSHGGTYPLHADTCGTFTGLNFGNSACADTCRSLPSCLSCWVPFDEGTGITANEVLANRDLSFQGAGASWSAGCCGSAVNLAPPLRWLQCAASYPEQNVGTGSFSVFARIKTNNANDGNIHQILDKRFPNPDLVHPLGYSLYIYQGKVYLQLGDGTGLYHDFGNTTALTDGQCHLVGATVCRNGTVTPPLFTVSVYLDNSITTYSAPAIMGNLNNASPFRVGEQNVGFLTGTPFNGLVDDVQIYKCCLTTAQVSQLYLAGVACNQCGTGAYVPSMAMPWFFDPTGAHINLRLCNYSLSPVTLAWSLAGLPGGSCPGANANGPTIFSPATGTVTLGPAIGGPTCVNIPVRIQIPGSYVATDVGCYEATVKNLTTGSCTFAEGEVRPLRIIIGHGTCCAVPAVPGAATPIRFTLGNNSSSPQTVTYRLSGNSCDGDTANQVVSLNGLPPGTPYIGQLDLAPGDSSVVDVQAMLDAFQPLNINEVVLAVSANGAWDAISTTALESMTSEEAADTPVLPGPSLETAANLYAAPNPFLGRTAVRFSLSRSESVVRVSVFDVAGRLVRDLHVGPLAAGDHEYQWDGLDSRGEKSPKGLYFIRVQAPGVLLKTKIVRMD